MLQPYVPEERIVSSLIEEQLSGASQSRVYFSMPVKVWSMCPAAISAMQI